jgi:hypothetical protein
MTLAEMLAYALPSIRDAARDLGIRRQVIRRWLAGLAVPSRGAVEAIIARYGLAPAEAIALRTEQRRRWPHAA